MINISKISVYLFQKRYLCLQTLRNNIVRFKVQVYFRIRTPDNKLHWYGMTILGI